MYILWPAHMHRMGHVCCMDSVQFSLSVVSDSLRPHESQHARPPCPSPTPGVYPNLCASSQWCHPTISSSVAPFSSCPQSFPSSGSFPKSLLFTSGMLQKTLILSHFGDEGTFKRNRINCAVLKIHSSHLPRLDRKYGSPLSVLSIYFVQFFFNIEEKSEVDMLLIELNLVLK